MPEAKPKPAASQQSTGDLKADLIPAGESGNPEVQRLLAELATARANGAADDAQDIVTYLGELGYSA